MKWRCGQICKDIPGDGEELEKSIVYWAIANSF